MFRIQRFSNGGIVFTLSGHIDPEHVDELRRLLSLEPRSARIVLNLRELVKVEGYAVDFLIECEAAGIVLDECSNYVRRWIDQRKDMSG